MENIKIKLLINNLEKLLFFPLDRIGIFMKRIFKSLGAEVGSNNFDLLQSFRLFHILFLFFFIFIFILRICLLSIEKRILYQKKIYDTFCYGS